MLGDDLCCNVVCVPADVIDKHLKDANEAQLKIYLYLLRNSLSGMITVESIADYFNYTIQDVERALKFWGLRGSVSFKGQEDNVVSFKKKPAYTAAQLADFAERDDIKELLFVTEQYVGSKRGCGMNTDLIATVLYMYDSLHFDTDLIINLFEYCVEHKKNKLYQIEAVANEWSEAGVRTVSDARKLTVSVPKEVYETMKAFKLKTNYREPSDSEISYVKKWITEYGFGMDVISVACDRTLTMIHDPSFSYANSILFSWHEAGVKTKDDIAMADAAFKKKNEAAKAGSAGKSSDDNKTGTSKAAKTDKFHNFEQRKYDFEQLEKEASWQ